MENKTQQPSLHSHIDDFPHSTTLHTSAPYPGTVGQPHSADNGVRIVGSMSGNNGPGPLLMLADTLYGNKVINMVNENVGSVKGIMLDVQGGRIAYAVLSVGGFLGRHGHVGIETGSELTLGASVVDWRGITGKKPNAYWVTEVDDERFFKCADGGVEPVAVNKNFGQNNATYPQKIFK